MSLLHKVVSHGRIHQLKLLLRMKPEFKHINSRDDSGKTAVILCAFIDNEDLGLRLLNILLEDPRTDHDTEDVFNRNIFTYAVIKGRKDMVNLLLENQGTISINKTDANGMSNLHHAVINGNLEVLSALIKAFRELDLSIDPQTPDGLTPLNLAVKLEHFQSANILLIEGSANFLTRDPIFNRNTRSWIDLKMQKYNKKYHEDIARFALLSRAKTEQRITMRRRGPRPPPRSALTAPTTGLPFLTTRPSTTKTEMESSNLVKLNELKRLKFHLEIKTSKPGQSSRQSFSEASTYDDMLKRDNVASTERCSNTYKESLPLIYDILQQKLRSEQQTLQPLLPRDCAFLPTRNSSAHSFGTHKTE